MFHTTNAPAHQESIAESLNFSFGFRPTTIHPALLPGAAKGYGVLPDLAYDLTADDEPLKEHFLNLVNLLRAKHGIQRERVAKGLSRNKGKPHLSPENGTNGVVRPGISPKLLQQNSIRRISAQDASQAVGAEASGVLIP